MGWIWNGTGDAPEKSSSNPRLGFAGIGELRNPNDGLERGDRCSTRRVLKSQCKTEETEPGKFVRRCEKTEQILRDCIGRPVEVVESNTEYTEDDVTEEMARGSLPFESSVTEEMARGSLPFEPFNFPGLRSDIEALERDMFGGLNRFFEAADEMKNGFFDAADEMKNGFFDAFGTTMDPPPFNRQRKADGMSEEGTKKREYRFSEEAKKKKKEFDRLSEEAAKTKNEFEKRMKSPYSEFSGQDGRIAYNEFVEMMKQGNVGFGMKGRQNSIGIGFREALKLG